ncbi:MAG: hypothetical protein DWP95_10330 [Proteobacteria bacterium]|nr:MAG: hypothetical protein DWP95_10330 [Pseudomonadota bacterium]
MTIIILWGLAVAGYFGYRMMCYRARCRRADQLKSAGYLCGKVPLTNIDRLEQWAVKYAPKKIMDRGFEFDNSKIYERCRQKRSANVIPMKVAKR